LPTEPTPDIRQAKWQKLMMNLIWNPLCAITQSSPGHIVASPLAADMVRLMLGEGSAVARSVGVSVQADPDAELERIRENFTQQPSMLQDVRAGRSIESDAIVNAVVDMARLTGVPVPHKRGQVHAALEDLSDDRASALVRQVGDLSGRSAERIESALGRLRRSRIDAR
jgi:2-dehydropantoate 2-reductase